MKALLRYFSYLFHGLLALFLLAVTSMALATDPSSLRLDSLQWLVDALKLSRSTLSWFAFGAAIAGLAIVVLAVLGRLRWLFFVWSVLVAAFVLKGFVFSGYHFETGSLKIALAFVVGALIALPGAWYQVAPPRPMKRY